MVYLCRWLWLTARLPRDPHLYQSKHNGFSFCLALFYTTCYRYCWRWVSTKRMGTTTRFGVWVQSLNFSLNIETLLCDRFPERFSIPTYIYVFFIGQFVNLLFYILRGALINRGRLIHPWGLREDKSCHNEYMQKLTNRIDPMVRAYRGCEYLNWATRKMLFLWRYVSFCPGRRPFSGC